MSRWQRIVGWFLVLSYAIGSPTFALIEARTAMFSQRFDVSPELLYLVSGIQVICALALLVRPVALLSAMALTVLSAGAVLSHLRIGSPITALPALAYTALQAWYGLRTYQEYRD